MLYKVSEKIARTVFEKDDKNLDEYIYGLELFFSSFVCTILLLLLGIVTKTFVESIVFILSFSALRVYTGGYHSNSFVLCNLFTLSIYVAIVAMYYFLLQYIVQWYVSVSIFAVTFIVILVFSPVENANKPLERSEHISCKIKAIIVIAIEIVAFYILLYIVKIESIAIMVPTLFFVDVLIVMGIIKNKGGTKNDKEK